MTTKPASFSVVGLALTRPYTFIVMALMILIFGPLAAIRTPTDIFPNIGIPVVGVAFTYVGLSPGNIASQVNAGQVSDPRAAVLEGLSKMRRLSDWGVPQFVLPPHERPAVAFLKSIGFSGSDAAVIESASTSATST